MRKVTRAIASMESIDFQRKKTFFNELTQVVGKLRKENNPIKFDSSGEIPSIVKKHTGLTIESVSIYESMGLSASISIFPMSKHTTMAHKNMRKAIERRGSAILNNLTGTVDLKESRVSGMFAELPSTLHLSTGLIYGRALEDDEVAAVILHEIGHAFTCFEYLVMTTTRSVVLANATEEFFSTKDKSKRIAVLVNVQRDEGLDIDDTEALLELETDSEGKKVFQCLIETARLKKDRVETGNSIYGGRAPEQLADQFAARHGAARSLAIALDKVHKSQSRRSLRSPIKNVYIETSRAALLLLMPLAAITYWPANILIASAIIGMAGSSADTAVYDDDRERLIKMRSSLIDQAKDKDLPKEISMAIPEDVKYIDGIIEKYHDNKSFFDVMFRFASRAYRNKLSAIEVQNELERLSSNDLYLSAVQLKNITYKA